MPIRKLLIRNPQISNKAAVFDFILHSNESKQF
jgi:hypothetical protein